MGMNAKFPLYFPAVLRYNNGKRGRGMEPQIFGVPVFPRDWARLAPFLECLPPARAERLRRLAVPQACLSLAGELLVRYALRRVFGAAASTLCFAASPGGKPYLVHPQGLHFNLSHSGHWCVCAVHDRPVGVDIQQVRPARFSAIAKRYFSPADCARLQAEPEPEALFYTLWTQREALGKLLGVGLRPLPKALPPVQMRWETPAAGYRLCVCWECEKEA